MAGARVGAGDGGWSGWEGHFDCRVGCIRVVKCLPGWLVEGGGLLRVSWAWLPLIYL